MESKRMIAVSLAKLQGFRTQRGGMRLHRGLLVSYVLRNAKQAYLGEKYRQLCEYQQYQQQQQEKEQQQEQQEQQQQWTCGDRSPRTLGCSHSAPLAAPAVPAAETTAPATTTTTITEKSMVVSTSDSTTTTTTLATELPGPLARLCRKRSSSEEGADDDDDEGSPPKRPRIQQQHYHHQQQEQQQQKPSPAREVSTTKAGEWKGPHIVRYHPQPLGQLSLNCMAVAAC
uniref:Immediate early response gene 5-like protein n=1 Tax=Petromyzon marinus TaxID=7757 RepID=A0AAJ7U9F7_PETMA|nr:immediate early response gene 5-like protein [Petromyzon marinus]